MRLKVLLATGYGSPVAQLMHLLGSGYAGCCRHEIEQLLMRLASRTLSGYSARLSGGGRGSNPDLADLFLPMLSNRMGHSHTGM